MARAASPPNSTSRPTSGSSSATSSATRMPGCLGLDALWQLTGFHLGWLGMPGKGRALGVGEVKFSGMVTPSVRLVRYTVDFKRIIDRKLKLGIADGTMEADGQTIYVTTDMRVGLFQEA